MSELYEYSSYDLLHELEGRGYKCVEDDTIEPFEHVQLLLLIGQVEAAKEECLNIVSEIVGRSFK